MDIDHTILSVHPAHQNIPVHHFAGDRSEMPVHAYLFALRNRSSAETRIVERRLVNGKTHQPLQTGRRAWV